MNAQPHHSDSESLEARVARLEATIAGFVRVLKGILEAAFWSALGLPLAVILVKRPSWLFWPQVYNAAHIFLSFGVALVALRSPALRDPCYDDLVHVRSQRLVQPRTLKPFFENQMLLPRDHAHGLDQGLAVGFDREVFQSLPRLRDHCQRAARGVDVDADVPFHRCLLLLGVVGLRELVSSRSETSVSTIIERDIISVPVTTDQKDCARTLSRYGFLALPVVDEIGRLVGVITADDLIQVAEEEATEDMYRMVGITGEGRVFGPVYVSVLKRLPWLVTGLWQI